jgi:hypothetical protein
LVPHDVPFVSLAPVSMQTGAPVEQTSVPLWQGFAGLQAVPAAQATQLPPLQTMPVPHVVPSGRLPVVPQTEAPVAHDVVPALQTVPAGVHALLAAQAVHAPLLHT